MRSRTYRSAAAFLVFCAIFASCSAQDRVKRLAAESLSIRTAGGAAVALRAEIAANDEDRARGLMFRDSLPEGEGMLFAFESDRRLSFWMKNTRVPLSIAFIVSDGRIVEIRDMEPLSLAAVESERSVRYALEVPRGWFSRAGVSVGDTVELPARFRR